MALRNTESAWGWLSKWLHWVIAVLMLTAITCAIWAAQLDPEVPGEPELWRFLIMKMHKPIGFTALVLIAVRIAWTRSGNRPALPSSMSNREIRLSKAVHLVLYALMLVVPVSGWFMSQYADSSVDYFGLFEIGNVVDPDKEMVSRLHPIHTWLGLTTLGLVVIHVIAAFFHEYVRKDNVLSSMLPRGRAG